MLTFITDTIAIGSGEDAQDLEALSAAGIRSILCLNGLLRGCAAEACGVERLRVFDFKDGPGNDPGLFEQAVRAVGTFAREAPKVLVHCHAGRSRSVVVVAGHGFAHAISQLGVFVTLVKVPEITTLA